MTSLWSTTRESDNAHSGQTISLATPQGCHICIIVFSTKHFMRIFLICFLFLQYSCERCREPGLSIDIQMFGDIPIEGKKAVFH